MKPSGRLAAAAVAMAVGLLSAPDPVAAAPAADSPQALAERVHAVTLRLAPADRERLRHEPRSAVPVELAVDGVAFPRARVHLKGSLGSFQPVDARPSLTLRLDPGAGAPFGMARLHLNNGAEDPGLLHEVTGLEVFRRAGLDAPGAGHARVVLDGRDLGLMVLREGFGPDYLGRHFGKPGAVLEPGPAQDIDGWADVHGRGPVPDREAVAAALALEDPDASWAALSRWVDPQRLADFTAAEVVAGHRDGYAMARNNYRYCLDPETGRVVFLPHGMDQVFDPPGLPWRPEAAGKAVRTMFRSGAGSALYAERFRERFARVADAAALDAFVVAANRRLLSAMSPAERPAQQARCDEFRERVRARLADLARQLATPDPSPPQWQDGRALLTGWQPFDLPQGGALEVATNRADRTRDLVIRAGPVTAASWRTVVVLGPGRYRFTGEVRTEGVEPLPFGRVHGASLRVVGTDTRSTPALGTTAPTPLSVEFRVGETTRITLACELRASSGQARFNADSLALHRADEPKPPRPTRSATP